MTGPSRRPHHALRPLQGAALALLLAPAASSAVSSADLETEVGGATAQLRQAWAADPTTAVLPFPAVRLLPRGASVAGACNPKEPPRRPAPLAAYCAAKGEVLLDQDLLAVTTAKAPTPKARAVAAYWIATALAERLLSPPPEGGAAPAALPTLLANCLGGVLLGASPAPTSTEATTLLTAARMAFGDSYSRAVGSASQRAYALLSGVGATASSCSTADMTALARKTVPDPALFQRIEQLPPPERAFRSLRAAINSQCQPQPNQPCPRRISSSRSPVP